MFEGRKAKKAAKAYDEAQAAWEHQRDAFTEYLSIAQSFEGTSDPELMLKQGEALFYKVSGASLVEDRKGPGHYAGGSQGVSIPIGSIGGRSVRYRAGASRGHYVQGTPSPTAIDTGTVFVTNQRVVFQGSKQTRECLFSKLIGYHHADDGSTTFSVSNRQKPTVVHYGPAIAANFRFRLELALAHSRGGVNDLIAELQKSLAQIEAEKPAAPSSPVGG